MPGIASTKPGIESTSMAGSPTPSRRTDIRVAMAITQTCGTTDATAGPAREPLISTRGMATAIHERAKSTLKRATITRGRLADTLARAMPCPRAIVLTPLALVVFTGVNAALAQGPCEPRWLPGAGLPGANGQAFTMVVWDPDGAGPSAPKLVVGGSFREASLLNIAAYDLATGAWSALGSGINSIVDALAVLPNGDLVAGGYFTSAGGNPARYIARWNGSAWSPLGSGMNLPVYALTVMPNGDLIAGGSFISAGGVNARYLARWNGSAWSAVGLELNNWVYALTVMPNGDLMVGGRFTFAGGSSTNSIARWNGTAWSRLGSGMSSFVTALAVLPNGDLIAGGDFRSADGVQVNSIARWNGSAWSGLGSGIAQGGINALAVVPGGDLIVGGSFLEAGGATVNSIARWNGTAWSCLGSGTNNAVLALTVLPGGDLSAGGYFATAGGIDANAVARFGSSCRCPGDLDDGAGTGARDGGVTIDDLLYYLDLYVESNARADLDNGTFTGTPDGGVTIDDLLYYLFRYAEGC